MYIIYGGDYLLGDHAIDHVMNPTQVHNIVIGKYNICKVSQMKHRLYLGRPQKTYTHYGEGVCQKCIFVDKWSLNQRVITWHPIWGFVNCVRQQTGEGVKNIQKLVYVFYRRPFMHIFVQGVSLIMLNYIKYFFQNLFTFTCSQAQV